MVFERDWFADLRLVLGMRGFTSSFSLSSECVCVRMGINVSV